VTARLPDWAIYGAATCALLLVALAGRERADAPEAPPPLAGAETVLIGAPVRFDRTISVDPVAPGPGAPPQASAFSVSATGRWIVSGRIADGCRKAAILLGGGQALAAKVAARDGWSATLTTDSGGTAVPLAPAASLRRGERGYAVGYPEGRPGERALRLIGRGELETEGHGRVRRPVLVWALVGRTRGLHGPITGLDGGPVLDAKGRAVGVVLKETRRRGRLYSTTPESLAAAAPQPLREPAPGQPVTDENYGRAADSLRRDLRVAEVRCL
jgi:hypothetical protein